MTTNIYRLFAYAVISFTLSTLFLSAIYWGMSWLFEVKFEKMGWFNITIDLAKFEGCQIRLDYFIHSLLIILANIMHFGIFVSIYNALKTNNE